MIRYPPECGRGYRRRVGESRLSYRQFEVIWSLSLNPLAVKTFFANQFGGAAIERFGRDGRNSGKSTARRTGTRWRSRHCGENHRTSVLVTVAFSQFSGWFLLNNFHGWDHTTVDVRVG